MSVLATLWREIQYRKINFLSAVLAVVVAVAVYVAVATMCDASRRETIRLMRDLGFNLLIVPKSQDMAEFWAQDYATEEMPEDYVFKLATSGVMTVRHLVARLQQKIQWQGRTVLLTGILPEVSMLGRQRKTPMGLTLARGEAFVGYEIARALGIKKGQTIEIGGKKFKVTRVLKQKGSKDDIRLWAHLHDVQEILGKPGRINEIEALGCLCFGAQDVDRIRADVAKALPDTQVTEFESIARARARTRRMVEKYASFLLPVVLFASGLWVFLLALGNVRERRGEIGILRALGVSSFTIAVLFLLKAAMMGVLGALLGFAAGTELALYFGPRIFTITAKQVDMLPNVLLWCLIAAPVLTMLASYGPAMLAVLQDPAAVLREE
ncbi:MAG: ABC transporter permease [Armatimonadetes bacterium]|nr:ABC transporter permease [Armatimonadota bacterium]